jgi:hypothetical protein
MANELGIYNAMGWAHLQLRGGWKNLWITTAGYSLLIVALIVVTVRLNPDHVQSMLQGWTMGLLGLQCGVLLLFGCRTVGAAVRLDHTSRMIESHRLMPTPATSAIAGYLMGAPCQAMSLAAANFLIGAITAAGGNVEFWRWVIPNLVLGCFALFLWAVLIFFGFISGAAFGWMVGVFVVAMWMSNAQLLTLLPPLTVLSSPMMGQSIFAMRTKMAEFGWEYMVSMAAQVAIGAICFIGAARKYRRADSQAMGADLGLAFLAVWVGVSIVGLAYWDDFRPRWTRMQIDRGAQFVATVLASMLVALIPVCAAGRAEVSRRRKIRGGEVEARGILDWPLAITALAVGLTLLLLRPGEMDSPKLAAAGVVMGSFIFAMSFLVRMVEKGKKRVWLIMGAYVVVSWAGPIIVDHMWFLMAESGGRTVGEISAFSPAAALYVLWMSEGIDIWLGVIFQAGVAVVLGMILYGGRWREGQRGGIAG